MNLVFPSAVLALLAICAVGSASEEPPTITTAPIFLPYYHRESWSLVRGSVISSNPEAHETTYTIFCPDAVDANPPECDLSLEFPFILIEGPDTIQFHGTHTSTFTANLECTLHGTTEATCSGYSSFNDGYDNGVFEGPTEVTWTSTFSADEMEWGVLTMAELPDDPDSFTATWSTPGVSDFVSIPVATDIDSAGVSIIRGSVGEAVLAAACSALTAGWLL
ncbi:hypothetical protein ACJ41O_008228 [Fusarium nematophilum]